MVSSRVRNVKRPKFCQNCGQFNLPTFTLTIKEKKYLKIKSVN